LIFSKHFFAKNRENMRLCLTHHLAALGFTAMTAFVHAAPGPIEGPINPGAGALQQELQRQVPKLQPLPSPVAPAPKAKPQEAKPSEVKVTIKGFRIDGNKNLSEDLIKETLKPWLGKTVPFQELQKAADAVAALYQSQGKLAQVSVPPQKITDGIVILKVLEAKLGAVHIDMPNGPSRFTEDRARRYITDANRLSEIVQTQNIERSIYILNETPGVAVSTQLEPGKNEGDVDLRVSLADTPMLRGRVEGNNYGSRATGIGQRTISMIFDGVGGFGDQLAITNIKSTGSDFTLGSFSVPLNSDGLRAGVTGSYLDYINDGKFAYPLNPNAGFGRAKTVGANLTYPTLRSPGANSNITASLDRKMYINKKVIDGSMTSNYNIENMSVGFNANKYDQLFGGGVTQGAVTLTKGNINWGAETLQAQADTPAAYGSGLPRNFTKIYANISRSQQIVPDKTILNINLSGQTASVELDSAERFYLGGPNGIKGYPSSQGSGSQGAMMNLELQQALEEKVIASVFFDIGFVQQHRDKANYQQVLGANNSYSLKSAGLGLKRPGKDIIWSASINWKLGHNPLLDYRGRGINNDGRSNSAHLWAQMQWVF
jgi:hemolysin activation/secretion protein